MINKSKIKKILIPCLLVVMVFFTGIAETSPLIEIPFIYYVVSFVRKYALLIFAVALIIYAFYRLDKVAKLENQYPEDYQDK